MADNIKKITADELSKCPFIPEKNRVSIAFFTVAGFDVFNAGSIHLNNGGIVGLPVNFGYSTAQDVERKLIEVGGKKVSWSSDAGKLLENALIISDSAKRFVVNRELYYLTYDRHLDMAFTILLSSSVYSVGAYFNARLQLFARPRFMRFIMYGILFSMGLVMWIGAKDATRNLYDSWADEQVAKLGLEYIEGGIEYYTKCMQKNAALHILLGSKGGNWYTPNGNYNTWVRAYSMPLQQRIDNLKKKHKLLCEADGNGKEDS